MTKKTNDTLVLVGLLVAIGGVLCTVGTTPPAWLAAKLRIPNNIVTLTGIGFFVVGIGLLWRIFAPLFNITPRKPGLQAARKSDLKELYSLYFKHFGREAPRLDQMRRWHARNRRIFQILVAPDPETRCEKIVASFKAVPLKDDAIPLLELEQVTGSTLPEVYISRTKRGAAAWYIGDLVSTSESSARAIIKALVTYLDQSLAPGVSVYARPLTEKGFHYLQEHHFEAVDGELKLGAICRLMGDEVIEEMARLRSAVAHRARQRATKKAPLDSSGKESALG